jgi:diguanylate cyclase (GGDEF)-like protein
MRIPARRRVALIAIPVLVIACAVFATATIERGSARGRSLSLATWLSVGIAAGLAILLVLAGILLRCRTIRRESRLLEHRHELRELLQVSASEEESQRLVIGHVERIVAGSGAAMFTRNDTDDRLEARLTDRADQTPLRAINTDQLHPRSCLAVRLSRTYERNFDDQPLLQCEACGMIAADVLCEPLRVGGQVIGSVLVTRVGAISATERDHVRESVIEAAPILVNQRNLELAERRAASDALTGLPNRRAADETIRRMVALAGRSVTPLSVIVFDLDHFKQVNDLHGHDRGDKALAAIGQIVSATLRTSDFAARYGGDQFLLLLPDTGRPGAVDVAEKLRRCIERAEITDIGRLTASFGIAALPDDGGEPERLLHKAARALYAAKANGRNRVQVATAVGPGELFTGSGNGDGLPAD